LCNPKEIKREDLGPCEVCRPMGERETPRKEKMTEGKCEISHLWENNVWVKIIQPIYVIKSNRV
jgi:hypothetical protein